MKKLWIILIIMLSLTYAYANDTYFFMTGGQLVPTKETDIEVEMKEEIINIVLNSDYYEITVDFSFYNNGKKVNLEIGFPFFCVGLSGHGKISDFRCWTNDVETSYVDMPIVKEWADDTQLENAYVRTITFPAKKTTTTRITYKSTYGMEAPSYFIAKYLYGTGSSWKNAIGKMTVRIQNNCRFSYPVFVGLPGDADVKLINENTWEGVYTNIEPEEYNKSITVIMGDIFGDDGPRILNKDKYFGCRREIKADDLFWYTKPQLRFIRNAIYAFHGYPFKSQDLIQWFEKDCVQNGWFGFNEGNPVYPLDSKFSEDKLSDIEKYNVKLILEEESRR